MELEIKDEFKNTFPHDLPNKGSVTEKMLLANPEKYSGLTYMIKDYSPKAKLVQNKGLVSDQVGEKGFTLKSKEAEKLKAEAEAKAKKDAEIKAAEKKAADELAKKAQVEAEKKAAEAKAKAEADKKAKAGAEKAKKEADAKAKAGAEKKA